MKKSLAVITLMLASGICLGADIGSRTEVYRWKDGAGVVHYSDTPPTGVTFTRVRLASSLTTTVVAPATPSQGVEKSTPPHGIDTSAGGDFASGTAPAGVGPKMLKDPY